jgi:hypothetical protein
LALDRAANEPPGEGSMGRLLEAEVDVDPEAVALPEAGLDQADSAVAAVGRR